MPVSLLIALYIALCLAPVGLSAVRIAEPRHWTDELDTRKNLPDPAVL